MEAYSDGRFTKPNAVSVEHAGFWLRLAAYMVDSIVLVAILWIVGFVLGATSRPEDPAQAPLLALAYIFMIYLYYGLFESSFYQATLGKMLVGLRVVDDKGGRISFGRASARFFSKFLSGMIFNVGYLMAGWTKDKQALHDIIAKTYVIRDH